MDTQCDRDDDVIDDDPDSYKTPKSGFFTVAVVLHDKVFGGAAEGGWWFDSYDPVIEPDMPAPSIHSDWESAKAADAAMEEALRPFNEGRPDVSSVISIGRYIPYIFDGYPRYEPQERPRYE